MENTKLRNIPLQTLLSGGVASFGSLDDYLASGIQRVLSFGLNALIGQQPKNTPYISDATRRERSLPLSSRNDGEVNYLARGNKFLERALIQTTHQITYGYLRSFPRYFKYLEQRIRDEHLQNKSDTSYASKEGQYRQLISEQRPVLDKKTYGDKIVGNLVYDYLELNVPESGEYYNFKTGSMEPIKSFGAQVFIDLHPEVQVSSKNNVLLTTVQGRDYTRKELISGGDFEITINGKIASKYAEVYPEAEVSKFLKLMQYRGILTCHNTILSQFNITQLIVLNYQFGTSEFRNIQPYSLTCVAVEPADSIQIKTAVEEKIETSVLKTNKWLKLARIGLQAVDPSSLLKFSPWV